MKSAEKPSTSTSVCPFARGAGKEEKSPRTRVDRCVDDLVVVAAAGALGPGRGHTTFGVGTRETRRPDASVDRSGRAEFGDLFLSLGGGPIGTDPRHRAERAPVFADAQGRVPDPRALGKARH